MFDVGVGVKKLTIFFPVVHEGERLTLEAVKKTEETRIKPVTALHDSGGLLRCFGKQGYNAFFNARRLLSSIRRSSGFSSGFGECMI